MPDKTPSVVMVDDDPLQTRLVGRWLEREGYAVTELHHSRDCLDLLSETIPDVVMLDIHMPELDGLELLSRLERLYPFLPVVMLTSEKNLEVAVSAMQKGAYDYLTKPVERSRLLAVMAHARDHQERSLTVRTHQREATSTPDETGIISVSEPMSQVMRQLDRLMASDVTVLLHGESGTGKELVARAIHRGSGRRDGSLVAVNCAAIPENLQESELFGHVRGAFTGADRARTGRIEEADGGTLFLDEVAELTPAIQGALLRVLQERTFRPVGADNDRESDFRVVAASHKKLVDEVEAGRFRQDLFYRLSVFELEIPALRDRPEDIPPLARHFTEQAARQEGHEHLEIGEEAMRVLMLHDWPGNVRELQNAIRRAAVLATDGVITPEGLPPALTDAHPPLPRRESGQVPLISLAELEERAIRRAYEETDGNISEMGRILGVSRATLYRKLDSYGLRE